MTFELVCRYSLNGGEYNDIQNVIALLSELRDDAKVSDALSRYAGLELDDMIESLGSIISCQDVDLKSSN